MQLIFVLLAVVGVALILNGIFRAADSDGEKPTQDEGHGVDVVWRVDHSDRRR